MNHITEFAVGAVLLVVAAAGAMFAVQPKPKPEPPPSQAETHQEALERCKENPDRMCVVRVEPMPTKEAQQQKVKQIDERLKHVETQATRIERKLEALDEVENGSNGNQR